MPHADDFLRVGTALPLASFVIVLGVGSVIHRRYGFNSRLFVWSVIAGILAVGLAVSTWLAHGALLGQQAWTPSTVPSSMGVGESWELISARVNLLLWTSIVVGAATCVALYVIMWHAKTRSFIALIAINMTLIFFTVALVSLAAPPGSWLWHLQAYIVAAAGTFTAVALTRASNHVDCDSNPAM